MVRKIPIETRSQLTDRREDDLEDSATTSLPASCRLDLLFPFRLLSLTSSAIKASLACLIISHELSAFPLLPGPMFEPVENGEAMYEGGMSGD